MYVMDEPSIGLHPRDTERLLNLLCKLRDKGNTILVVEHDPEIIKSAEWIVDIGPKAGVRGGEVVFNGKADEITFSDSITGKYLQSVEKISTDRKEFEDWFSLENVTVNNLKNVSVKIPKGVLTCVTGVAGSGKSSLINEYFVKKSKECVVIDQSPIGANVRSNPATYIGIFDLIRKEFARVSGESAALFSFNSEGACPKCNGKGYVEVEMSFMDEIHITCDECEGKRYREEVLEYQYNGKNIFDVLNMTVNQAYEFFDHKEIRRRLEILVEVGLGYLGIGQPLSTLSGGEAQRIKLASELHKRGNVYVLDEPTTGLHMADIERLVGIIKKLVNNDNTVVVIEHNLDVIKHADWIIDMGPEGGVKGGKVIFEGTPENLALCEQSYTGRFLRSYLN